MCQFELNGFHLTMVAIDGIHVVFRGGSNEDDFESVVVVMCCRWRILMEFRIFFVIW